MTFIKDFFNEMVAMIKPYCKYIKFSFVFILFFISSIFQLIPIMLLNIDINSISNTAKYLLNLFSEGMTLLILFLLYFKEIKKQFIKFKNYTKNKLFSVYNKAFIYWLIGVIIMIISNFLIRKLGGAAAQNDTNVINRLESAPFIFSISVLFIKPIIEELVFRLAFKDIFRKKWLFILLSGIIFGSIHVVISSVDLVQLLYLIPYCSLGIAFSYIYYDSDNIYVPISMHILHNTLIFVTSFLMAGVCL